MGGILFPVVEPGSQLRDMQWQARQSRKRSSFAAPRTPSFLRSQAAQAEAAKAAEVTEEVAEEVEATTEEAPAVEENNEEKEA